MHLAARSCARKVWISSGKSFIMSTSAMEMSWIVTGSEVAQASDMYTDFAQKEFFS